MNSISEVNKIAASFHKKAVEYDCNIQVQKRVVAQLVNCIKQRLTYIPKHILDIGTGTGSLLEKLHLSFPDASMTGIDIAPNMCIHAKQKLGDSCSIVNANAEVLPFKTADFDLVVSSSALQWVVDLKSAMQEMRRVLKPGGVMAISFFCEGTLSELHDCFTEVSRSRLSDKNSILSRLHNFKTVDDVNSIVSKMDFKNFVINVETETDWYNDLYSLLRSIKNIGAGSISNSSAGGLGWRGILNETGCLYQEKYGVDGRIPVTYKILNITASVAV